MKTYRIYGSSDDLIEVEGAERHEYSVPSSEYGRFRLSPGDDVNGGVHIHVRYEDCSGCWSVGVSPVAEDVPVPAEWTFEVLPQGKERCSPPAYSSALVAVVADDAVLTWEGDE